MKKDFRLFFVCCFLCIHSNITSQETQQVDLKSFSIMVIPYLEDTEKISVKLKEHPEMRLAIANLQDAFLSKGLKIVDFGAKYIKYQQDEAMNGIVNDVKASFVDYASPDIFVELEASNIRCSSDTHKARVRLKTYLTATSDLIADKVSDSNCFDNDADYVLLIKQSVSKFLDDYLSNLQVHFQNMADLGQPVQIHITVGNEAGFDLNTIVNSTMSGMNNDMPLSKMIALWLFQESEMIKSFSPAPSGNTGQRMVLDAVRIQLFDKTGKRIFPISLFSLKMWTFLSSLATVDGLKIKTQESAVGRTIYFNLNK